MCHKNTNISSSFKKRGNRLKQYNIYLDNAATTKIIPAAFNEMEPYLKEYYGNASGSHRLSKISQKAIYEAREQVATVIGTNVDEIYFTGGGTEANNWAIKGIAFSNKEKGNHIITTNIEHHSVIYPCHYLEKNHGFKVTYLPTQKNGTININDLKSAISKETILISVMFANNETGALQPIKEIGDIASEHNIIFHTDAVQAVGHIPINLKDLNINLLSISGHKVYGPKGIGALYIRGDTSLPAFIHGGAQEKNRRSGTENVPAIVGFGKAISIVHEEMGAEGKRLRNLSEMAINSIIKTIPESNLNGRLKYRLPNIFNISFKNIDIESILLMLDAKGIVASSGSACTSGTIEPSHVLIAMGLTEDEAMSALRVSLGRYNTEDDIKSLVTELQIIVEKLRLG